MLKEDRDGSYSKKKVYKFYYCCPIVFISGFSTFACLLSTRNGHFVKKNYPIEHVRHVIIKWKRWRDIFSGHLSKKAENFVSRFLSHRGSGFEKLEQRTRKQKNVSSRDKSTISFLRSLCFLIVLIFTALSHCGVKIARVI